MIWPGIPNEFVTALRSLSRGRRVYNATKYKHNKQTDCLPGLKDCLHAVHLGENLFSKHLAQINFESLKINFCPVKDFSHPLQVKHPS